MTAPILWPASLPLYPSSTSFSGQKQPGKHAFTPESGSPITRAKQSVRVDVYSYVFDVLTKTQMETFRTFYDDTLAQGSLKFAWAHPIKQVPREAQIIGEPTESALNGPLWSLAFQVLMVDTSPAYSDDIFVAENYIAYVSA